MVSLVHSPDVNLQIPLLRKRHHQRAPRFVLVPDLCNGQRHRLPRAQPALRTVGPLADSGTRHAGADCRVRCTRTQVLEYRGGCCTNFGYYYENRSLHEKKVKPTYTEAAPNSHHPET